MKITIKDIPNGVSLIKPTAENIQFSFNGEVIELKVETINYHRSSDDFYSVDFEGQILAKLED